MAEGEGLSQAFAERHPEEAANALEGLAEEEVADFLAALPVSVAAPVAEAMLPLPAAGVVGRMGTETGGALLAALAPQAAAALLRCMVSEQREALLARVRPGRRAALALLLSYPVDTVGAWADPRTLSLRRDASVAWARAAVAASAAPVDYDLYVLGGDHRLAGCLPVGRLLRRAPEVRLERVMDPSPPALPATNSIGEARGDSAWIGRSVLPVVDGSGYLLGAVTEEVLDRALGGDPGGDPLAEGGALGALTDTCLQAGAGLLREVWSLLVPAAGTRREDSP